MPTENSEKWMEYIAILKERQSLMIQAIDTYEELADSFRKWKTNNRNVILLILTIEIILLSIILLAVSFVVSSVWQSYLQNLSAGLLASIVLFHLFDRFWYSAEVSLNKFDNAVGEIAAIKANIGTTIVQTNELYESAIQLDTVLETKNIDALADIYKSIQLQKALQTEMRRQMIHVAEELHVAFSQLSSVDKKKRVELDEIKTRLSRHINQLKGLDFNLDITHMINTGDPQE